MIVHLVQFNKQHANRPPSFTLPVVEDLAFLIELHYLRAGQGCLAFSEDVGRYLCDPFLRALDDLRLEAPEGAPMLAFHVDLKNAFWSLRLPDAFRQAFRVSIDGQTFAFNCLPFGWQYSPVICRTVLGYLPQGLDLVSVLVLHYLDDFLVLGFGAGNVRLAAARLGDLLGRQGAIISPKSILEPVPSIVWLGKKLVLSGAGQGVFVVPNQWIVLLGLWLRVALLPLSRKLARRVIGRFSWALRPQVGACPFLAGWWSRVMWGSSFLPSAPLKLVHSLLHCLVMSRRGWAPRRIDSPSSAGRGLVFVDAAFDLDRFKVGLWGPALGGRVFRCGLEVLTQQEAELDSLVQGLNFIVNVGWPVFRMVGDNASSLGQLAGMRARSGLKRHTGTCAEVFTYSRGLIRLFSSNGSHVISTQQTVSPVLTVISAATSLRRGWQLGTGFGPCRLSPPSLALYGLQICPRDALLWTDSLHNVLWGLSLSVGGTLRRAGCWGPLAFFRQVPLHDRATTCP